MRLPLPLFISLLPFALVSSHPILDTNVIRRSSIPFSKHSITLTGHPNKHSSSRLSRRQLNPPAVEDILAFEDIIYTTQIRLGNPGKLVEVIVDTASPDTWVIADTFQCYQDWAAVPQDWCNFSTLYNVPSSTRRVRNQYFKRQYRDDRWMKGYYTRMRASIAGVQVPNQTIGIGLEAQWRGFDGLKTSGVLGLGLPKDALAYAGNFNNNSTPSPRDFDHDCEPGSRVQYSPFFASLADQKLVAPLFSLALERIPEPAEGLPVYSAGTLTIGGVEPNISYTGSFVGTPIAKFISPAEAFCTDKPRAYPSLKPDYHKYAIHVDGWTYRRSNNTFRDDPIFPDTDVYEPVSFRQPRSDYSPTNLTLIDPSVNDNYFPVEVANALYPLFDPPATIINGRWRVRCSGRVPLVGVNIGGKTFWIHPIDLMRRTGRDECLLLFEGRSGWSILGAAFLKNVVAVFDYGGKRMEFAARNVY